MALAMLFMSCDEDSLSSLYFTVKIDGSEMGTVKALSNTTKKISITGAANETRINRLTISTFDSERGEVLLLDTALNNIQEISYDYFYKVPMLKATTVDLTMTFKLYASDGFEQKWTRQFVVVSNDYYLEEKAGLFLYATENADHANGLCLRNLTPIKVSLADSAQIDVYTYVDESNPDLLTCEWRTNTDINFARANNFDYANATNRSVAYAYETTLRYPTIKDIREDDIILIGRGTEVLGVIRVVLVSDEDGSDRDRYMINVKCLRDKVTDSEETEKPEDTGDSEEADESENKS